MKNAAPKKGKRATRGSRAGGHDAHGKQDEEIELMAWVTWTDPLRQPEAFIIKAPFNSEAETACLHLDIKLRSVASIEVRPARRPLKDTAGVVADALRLANS